jgi:hypothetical protein
MPAHFGEATRDKFAFYSLDDSDCERIAGIEYTHHKGGVIHFHNVFNIDQDKILPYIDEMAYVPSCGLEIIRDDEGNMIRGETFDGKVVDMKDLLALPMRVGGMGMPEPVNPNTPWDVREFFESVEESLYHCLIRYCDLYPLIVNTIWWRMRGHCLKYLPGANLGLHNDNDTNTFVIDGQRYYSGREIAMYQVVNGLAYFNDDYEGGEMHFPYLDLTIKPKTGDIILFPGNYVGTHGVAQVKEGGSDRYTYLTQFGHGGEHKYEVLEPQESDMWLAPVYVPYLYQDHVKFSDSGHSHLDTAKDEELGFHASTIQGQARSKEGAAVGTKIPLDAQ